MANMRNSVLISLMAGTLLAGTLLASDTRLVDAVKNHDKDTVRSLLKEHVDVNAPEADGTSALHWAAHSNDLETVQLLLRAGANAKAESRYGVTPISEAATYGSAALIEALLKAGADANTLTTERGQTVLMTAARSGNLAAVKLLLEHGADANAKENVRGQTSLMLAAAEDHPDIVKLLIAHGADPKLRSSDRDTTPPKLMAGTPAAPISRGGLTALVFAARQGSIESATALIDAGADINQGDADGNNPLLIAILNNHDELAQILIDKGADVNAVNKDGRSPLFTAVDAHDVDWSDRPLVKETDKVSSFDVIKSLIDHKANVNVQLTAVSIIKKAAQDSADRTLSIGATPFMRAARSGDVELMRLLLDHGADPKLANKDGVTALIVAAGAGYTDSNRGTEPQALEAVKLCVELGLDVNAVTDKGETALHGAARRGANPIIQYLVDKGASINAGNKQGITPLDIAMGKGAPGGAPGLPKEQAMALIRQLGGTPGKEVKEVAAVPKPE
jgi:ankyrin repeat protein